MECHACEWSGKLEGVPYERTPCARCELREETPRGWATGMIEQVAAGARSAPPPAPVAQAPLRDTYPVAVLREALRLILSLPPVTYNVVQGAYQGLSASEIAARHGYTRRLVESRLLMVRRDQPLLTALFPQRPRRGPRARGEKLGVTS